MPQHPQDPKEKKSVFTEEPELVQGVSVFTEEEPEIEAVKEPDEDNVLPFFPSIAALLREDPKPLPIIQDLIGLLEPKQPDLRIPFKDRMTFDQAIGAMATDIAPFPLVLGADITRTPIDEDLVRAGDPDDFINFQATDIRPLKGPIGTGIIGGTVRGALNITESLKNNAPVTIASFVTAPFMIAYGGMREFVQSAASLEGDGSLFSEEFREQFGEISGDMILAPAKLSPHELVEARRAFQGLLASAAVGGVLFKSIGGPIFRTSRQIGATKAESVTQAKFIRAQTTAVTSLGVFGAVGGEPTEREKNFVMFGLAAIPLGLTFAAFRSLGKVESKVTDGPGRAAEYGQQRASRPFGEQETTSVPEVITRFEDKPVGIPLGKEIAREKTKPLAIEPELSESFTDLIERVGIEEARKLREVDPIESITNLVGEEAAKDVIGQRLEGEVREEGRVIGEIRPKTEPIEPTKDAQRLENYVQSEGDGVKIIIQNLETAESRMVIVPSTETPGRALQIARDLYGKDVIMAVHPRPDGRFDVAVGIKGSIIDNFRARQQFINEGFMAREAVSVNGKEMAYIGKTEVKELTLVRLPGDPRIIKVNTADIRRLKDVSVRSIEEPKVSVEKQLEGVISPKEIEVFKQLRKELHPQEPSTEPKTFDQIRNEASTNGLELTRTASNTYLVRDRATGEELFTGRTKEDAEAFINNSGQNSGVVFGGNIPIDTDVPGLVTPPPAPGLRVNEPFDFLPNSTMGSIIDLFQSLTPFITPFKDWTAAVDNILGTRMFSEVYLKTQETQGRSISRQMPWLKTLQKQERRLIDAKIPRDRWELITDFIETMSYEEMIGSPRTGKGLLKSRKVNANEISASDVLGELGIGTQKLYEFIRLREQLFDAEARIQKVKELDSEAKRSIISEIVKEKNMTPNEMAGVQLFDFIRTQDLNDISLYVVSRLTEAKRTGSLSRSDFAAKNEMTALEMDVAKEFEGIYDNIAALPDVPISDAQLIRGYTAHYAEHQTMIPEQSLLNQKGTSSELRFVNELIRSGEINAYDRNPVPVLARYIKNAFNSIEFNDAWNSAKRYVDTELGGQFGRDGSVASWVAKSYLSDIRGTPGASTQFTQKLVDTFFKKVGIDLKLNIRQDLVNTYLAMTNAAFMGARPGLAARDLMQLALFYISRFGVKRTASMLRTATRIGQEGTKQLRDAGELPTIGIVEFETAAQMQATAIGKTMGKLPAATRKVAEVGLTMSGQRNAYEYGYKGILVETKGLAGREIVKLIAGDITKEQAYENIGLDTYNLQTKKAFDQFVTAGEYERAANFLGQQTAREIMGVYGRANHPWGWGTNLGRLLTHYGTWSSNALAFTLGGMSRGSGKQKAAFATRFALGQGALWSTSQAVGLNMHSWMTLPGLFFTGGPAAQTAMLIGTSITGYGRDRELARQRLKRLLPAWDDPRSMFIPFSYVVGDLLQAVENADNPIEFFGRGFSIPLKRGRSWLDEF